MKEQIKELRVKIDSISQLVKELRPCTQLQTTVEYPDRSTVTYIHNELFDGKALKYNSQELNNSYSSLILAKAWLGKVLGELGEQTPYANDGKRKTVEDIEKPADTFGKDILTKNKEGQLINNPMVLLNNSYGTEGNTRDKAWKDLNHIEKVDWLRQEIEILTKVILPMHPNGEWQRHFLYEQKAYEYLCEARFWLGFELQRIKEQSDKSFQTHIIKEEGIKINK